MFQIKSTAHTLNSFYKVSLFVYVCTQISMMLLLVATCIHIYVSAVSQQELLRMCQENRYGAVYKFEQLYLPTSSIEAVAICLDPRLTVI